MRATLAWGGTRLATPRSPGARPVALRPAAPCPDSPFPHAARGRAVLRGLARFGVFCGLEWLRVFLGLARLCVFSGQQRRKFGHPADEVGCSSRTQPVASVPAGEYPGNDAGPGPLRALDSAGR